MLLGQKEVRKGKISLRSRYMRHASGSEILIENDSIKRIIIYNSNISRANYRRREEYRGRGWEEERGGGGGGGRSLNRRGPCPSCPVASWRSIYTLILYGERWECSECDIKEFWGKKPSVLPEEWRGNVGLPQGSSFLCPSMFGSHGSSLHASQLWPSGSLDVFRKQIPPEINSGMRRQTMASFTVTW